MNRTKTSKVKAMNTFELDEEIVNHGKVDDDEYIVEKIVDKKMIETDEGKKLHYNIKWKGWATAHNTWEPLANLDGCQEMVDKFEAQRQVRRDMGQDSDSAAQDSDEDSISEKDHMEKTRAELIEYGIATKWPTHLIPLKLIGVITVDKHLCYIVRHQTTKDVQTLGCENCIVIRAGVFRHLFPHIVISFYEGCVLWVERAETKEELEVKAMKALEEQSKIEDLKTEKIDLDQELDEVGLPIPKSQIKKEKDEDVFGLPESPVDSSSSEDDDFEEILVLPQAQSPSNINFETE